MKSVHARQVLVHGKVEDDCARVPGVILWAKLALGRATGVLMVVTAPLTRIAVGVEGDPAPVSALPPGTLAVERYPAHRFFLLSHPAGATYRS